MEATVAQGWEVEYANRTRWYVHLFPSLTDFAFLLPLFLLFHFLPGAQALLSDSDTGWHIRTGDWILQHGHVPTQDIFSFTKPHQAWFAWEWGWDVTFSTIHRFSGLNGVVLVNAVLLGLASALLFRLIRRCTDSDAAAVLFTPLAVCASTIHWLARPHLVSWIFVLVFLHILLSAEHGNLRSLYSLPILTILWTNLHGGFIAGIALVGGSAVAELIKPFLQARAERRFASALRKARPYLVATLGCLAASVINPYTWHLHQHIFTYLRDRKLLDNISEFQSIDFHHASSMFIEAMLLLGIPAAVWCLRTGRTAAALWILLWAHLTLESARNAPIFAFVAAPWIAGMSMDAARALAQLDWLKKLGAEISEICAELRPIERIERCHLVSIAAVLFIACSLAAGRPGFAAEFNPNQFPIEKVAALDTLRGLRVFTTDQWSGYLIYRFYPSERVFMDGRSDFYGDQFVATYQHIMRARYDCESVLRRFAIDAVLVSPDTPLATVLKRSPAWKTVFDNGSVIVFRSSRAVAEAGRSFSLNANNKERRRSL